MILRNRSPLRLVRQSTKSALRLGYRDGPVACLASAALCGIKTMGKAVRARRKRLPPGPASVHAPVAGGNDVQPTFGHGRVGKNADELCFALALFPSRLPAATGVVSDRAGATDDHFALPAFVVFAGRRRISCAKGASERESRGCSP